jgi:di/tricarboxylate transporter
MPMNIATILGGTVTLIGSSTNLVVAGLAESDRFRDPATDRPLEFSMFSFSAAGILYALCGLATMILLSQCLLPMATEELLASVLSEPRQYTVMMRVNARSNVDGKSIAAAGLRHLSGLFLAEIIRPDGTVIPCPGPEAILQGDDTLLFVGVVETVKELYCFSGLRPATDETQKMPAARHQRCLAEVVVATCSSLVGLNVREAQFRERFQAVIIAICRHGEIVHSRIGDVVFEGGDLLLIETGPNLRVKQDSDFALVVPVLNSTPAHESWKYMLWGFALVVGTLMWSQLARLNLMVCSSVCVCVMLASGCMTLQQAMEAVPVRLLVAMATSFGLAAAIDKSGVASELATCLLRMTDWAGKPGIVFAIYSSAALVTQVITNNAAAALMYAIASRVLASAGVT